MFQNGGILLELNPVAPSFSSLLLVGRNSDVAQQILFCICDFSFKALF